MEEAGIWRRWGLPAEGLWWTSLLFGNPDTLCLSFCCLDDDDETKHFYIFLFFSLLPRCLICLFLAQWWVFWGPLMFWHWVALNVCLSSSYLTSVAYFVYLAYDEVFLRLMYLLLVGLYVCFRMLVPFLVGLIRFGDWVVVIFVDVGYGLWFVWLPNDEGFLRALWFGYDIWTLLGWKASRLSLCWCKF